MFEYKKEDSLSSFEAWGQAVSTKETIIEHGFENEFDDFINECYEEGSLTDTQLNDLLAYDWEWVFETIGLKDCLIKEEVEDIISDLESMTIDEFRKLEEVKVITSGELLYEGEFSIEYGDKIYIEEGIDLYEYIDLTEVTTVDLDNYIKDKTLEAFEELRSMVTAELETYV